MSNAPYIGSAIQYDVVSQANVMIPMRDGVRLAMDLYFPAHYGRRVPGEFPTLIERTPYDKSRAFLVQTAKYFARRGYVTIMQDVRGRFQSEGSWYFLAAEEAPDGYDTLEWIARQPWSDGQVGTMGLSYTTATQQALAVLRPPALKAQFLLDGGYNYFHRTLRHSGACELGVLLPYVFRMARHGGHELADNPIAREAFERAWRDFRSWITKLPLRPDLSPLRLAPSYERWFLDMLTTSDYTEAWKHATCNLSEHIDDYADVPVFLETSWYGHHIWATTTKYTELLKRHKTPKKLLIGHWTHGYDDFARSWCGEVDFGTEAMLDSLNDLRLRWFDRWLKGLQTGIEDVAPVRLFVMGGGSGRKNAEGRLEHGGAWRDEEEWPLARTQWTPWYLHANGTLRPETPTLSTSSSSYTFNPADPVPTVGGGVQNPAMPQLLQGGAFDQRGRADLWVCKDTLPLATRQDVLVFQTAPLLRDMEVTGPITVVLWIASSAVDTDFTAKLVDVYPPNEDYPDGFAMNLTDGIQRVRYRNGYAQAELMTPGEMYQITLELQATSNLFKAGHRLRLDISSSNFPRFDVNPNTGEPPGRSRRTMVAHNTVYHDATHPSHVVLPVIPS